MYRRIVVPLDGSKVAEGVLPHIWGIAQATGAELVLLKVIERRHLAGGSYAISPDASVIAEKDLTAAAQKYLGGVAELLRARGLAVQRAVIPGLRPAEA